MISFKNPIILVNNIIVNCSKSKGVKMFCIYLIYLIRKDLLLTKESYREARIVGTLKLIL